jgi:hypothetical protein
MTAVVAGSTPAGIGNANTVDIMTPLPTISRMAATAMFDLRGGESGAASGREHGGAARKKLEFLGPSQLWDLLAFPGVLADGHTVSNAPDLFRPPKLSGTGPG